MYVTIAGLVRQRRVSLADRVWGEARGGFLLTQGRWGNKSGRICKAVELCYFGVPPGQHALWYLLGVRSGDLNSCSVSFWYWTGVALECHILQRLHKSEPGRAGSGGGPGMGYFYICPRFSNSVTNTKKPSGTWGKDLLSLSLNYSVWKMKVVFSLSFMCQALC